MGFNKMTERLRTILISSLVIGHMLFFSLWYASESQQFYQPVVKIMVNAVPVDPRDLLSGQYIRIEYAFSRVPNRVPESRVPFGWAGRIWDGTRSSSKVNKTVWVVLHAVEGFYEPKDAFFTKPKALKEGEVVIKGRIMNRRGRITYGIEKYFVPERTKEPNRADTKIELEVYETGSVRISKVYVKGELWP